MTAMPRLSKTRERILYVEYNEDCREMLAALLNYAGYDVVTATTFADGLGLARSDQFDLFILENRYPDGIGTELCSQIRVSDPDTPILFYSSSAYESDVKAGMDAGASHYLLKPEGIDFLEQIITGLLAGSIDARA